MVATLTPPDEPGTPYRIVEVVVDGQIVPLLLGGPQTASADPREAHVAQLVEKIARWRRENGVTADEMRQAFEARG